MNPPWIPDLETDIDTQNFEDFEETIPLDNHTTDASYKGHSAHFDDFTFVRRPEHKRPEMNSLFDDVIDDDENDEIQASPMVEVYGRRGLNDKRVNGRYVPHPTKTFGGRKVWKRIDMDTDPIVLWYWPRKKVWMMTRLSNVGGEQAYAAVRDSADNPADITRQWLVYDPIQKKHRLDQNVKIRPVPVSEQELRTTE